MKKQVGWIKLYRHFALECKKNLTDPEYRLLDILACLVRWDKKDKERHGTAQNLTIKTLKHYYLPDWATGKISEVLNSLITKDLVKRIGTPDKAILVVNFWIYQTSELRAEQAFQLIEQGIQPSETNIQLAEQKRENDLAKAKQEILANFNPFGKNVQPPEQNEGEQRN